jgi:hypothetical protein
MIRLRHEHKLSLKSDNLDFFYEDPTNQLFAYHRFDDNQTDHTIVIINWSGKTLEKCQVKGQWIEWLTKSIFNVNDDNTLIFDFEGQQSKVFIFNKQ